MSANRFSVLTCPVLFLYLMIWIANLCKRVTGSNFSAQSVFIFMVRWGAIGPVSINFLSIEPDFHGIANASCQKRENKGWQQSPGEPTSLHWGSDKAEMCRESEKQLAENSRGRRQRPSLASGGLQRFPYDTKCRISGIAWSPDWTVFQEAFSFFTLSKMWEKKVVKTAYQSSILCY